MENETSKIFNIEVVRLILSYLIRKTNKTCCKVRPEEDESNVLASSLERDASYPSTENFPRYNGHLAVRFPMRGLPLLCVGLRDKARSEGQRDFLAFQFFSPWFLGAWVSLRNNQD